MFQLLLLLAWWLEESSLDRGTSDTLFSTMDFDHSWVDMVQGLWSPQDSHLYIKILELQAAHLALYQFRDKLTNSCLQMETRQYHNKDVSSSGSSERRPQPPSIGLGH